MKVKGTVSPTERCDFTASRQIIIHKIIIVIYRLGGPVRKKAVPELLKTAQAAGREGWVRSADISMERLEKKQFDCV